MTRFLPLLVALATCACAEPVNFALARNGGEIAGPRNSSRCTTLPPVANDGRFDHFAWGYFEAPLVVRFSEPQTINVVELILLSPRTNWYRFFVEATPDGESWRRVADRTEGHARGRQTVAFDPIECDEVRITFTGASMPTGSYHVVEVGAFLLADSAEPSPLRVAYEKHLEEEERPGERALLRVLGDEARMTPGELEAVLNLAAGERITRDLDGDGDPDISDFLDTDPKHTIKPLVVRIIDDDDDMRADGLGDEDSDCYVADWRGDGTIDRAIDYWDQDGDGDADRMDIYYGVGAWHGGNKAEVVVIRDIGDDNMMWWTRNYEYSQYRCQWKSDFNGDEIFCMFGYDARADKFLAWLEEPFTHHDLDGDGVSELTSQFMGNGLTIRTLRHSFDADNDNDARTNRRDYDFSFNCRGWVIVPEDMSTCEELRNGETTGPYLDWPHARGIAEGGDWKSCRLCWDEIDNNVNPADGIEKYEERWEGVGGYPMREGNKRWETDKDYSGRMQLYYWPLDGRLHLLGAETGFINIDYDHDYKWDAKITYEDADGDGFFDTWSYDADADGEPEHTIRAKGEACELVSLEDYAGFVERYREWVREGLDADGRVIASLKARLGEDATSVYEDWWENQRPESFYAAEKLGASSEARRYYQDLIREELFLQARERFGREDWWEEFAAGVVWGSAGIR